MKKIFLTLVVSALTLPAFAADKYYASKAEEAKAKAEMNQLQRKAIQNAIKYEQRRKAMGAPRGAVVLTNDEIYEQFNLMGQMLANPETQRALKELDNPPDPYEEYKLYGANIAEDTTKEEHRAGEIYRSSIRGTEGRSVSAPSYDDVSNMRQGSSGSNANNNTDKVVNGVINILYDLYKNKKK